MIYLKVIIDFFVSQLQEFIKKLYKINFIF